MCIMCTLLHDIQGGSLVELEPRRGDMYQIWWSICCGRIVVSKFEIHLNMIGTTVRVSCLFFEILLCLV